MSNIVEKGIELGGKSSDLTLSLKGKPLTTTETVPRAEVEGVCPTLTLSNAPQGPLLVLGLDPDAPFASAPVLGPILHLVQPSMTADASGVLSSKEAPLASWVDPNPPPLSGRHRYLFLVFKQPSTFDLGAWKAKFPEGIWHRIRYNADAFASEAALGEPVAATWFYSV